MQLYCVIERRIMHKIYKTHDPEKKKKQGKREFFDMFTCEGRNGMDLLKIYQEMVLNSICLMYGMDIHKTARKRDYARSLRIYEWRLMNCR